MEAHGERIWVEDASGPPGARGSLRLHPPGPARWATNWLMARVLVIDDDKALLRALKVALTAKGHEVLSSATAEEGLSVLALALTGRSRAGPRAPRPRRARQSVHRIRSWSDVPVIVLSATALEDRKVAALDAGANDYVTKPFGMAELEARIRTALRHGAPPPATQSEGCSPSARSSLTSSTTR